MNKRRVDKSTLLGTFLAVSGIVGGLVLDGGSVRQILQPSAALIVLAGTLGCCPNSVSDEDSNGHH
jgi:chemotaxis protein MotA